MKRLTTWILFGVLAIVLLAASSQARANNVSESRAAQKADKKQQKAQKKYAKAQRKAERKMLKTERKNTRYPSHQF
jgi:hypothetical protein